MAFRRLCQTGGLPHPPLRARYKKIIAKISETAYAFTLVDDSVSIPSPAFLKRALSGSSKLGTNGKFVLLVAEQDGSSVKKPRAPNGMRMEADKLCPKSLHDEWVVTGTNESDPQTRSPAILNVAPVVGPLLRLLVRSRARVLSAGDYGLSPQIRLFCIQE